MNPASVAISISSEEKSPSGPMIITVSTPARYSFESRRRGCESSQCAMNFCGNRSVASIKRLNGVIGFTTGQVPFRLCFIAETAIFSIRSVLISLRSDHRHRSGVIDVTPVSVSFSVSHSILSRCFVGATPIDM